MCQRGGCALKGVDTRRCVGKEAGPCRGWIGGSHINRRKERVSTRTLGLEGGGGWIVRSYIGWGGERNIPHWASKGSGWWDPTLVGEKNETFFIRVWKPLQRVLKYFREPLKGKLKEIIFAIGEFGLLHERSWVCLFHRLVCVEELDPRILNLPL